MLTRRVHVIVNEVKAAQMDVEQWWSKLPPATQRYLVEHNGEVMPAAILAQIELVGGRLDSPDSWTHSWPDGYSLPDAVTDWIEATANGEEPTPHAPA